MTTPSSVVYVIMAGGNGERLWPFVRTQRPKVCLPIEQGRTLLEVTLRRVRPLANSQNTLIVTTASQAPSVRRVLPAAFHRTMLIEPHGKNTAACIALAATVVAHRDPGRVMVVLPADHWIQPAAAFRRSLNMAVAVASRTEQVVMIGVRPTRVHSGLGHLCVLPADSRQDGCRVHRLIRFIEKPSRAVAQRLMRRRQAVYWNAGIFIGQAGVFQRVIQQWLPTHAKRLFPLGRLVRRTTVVPALRSAYRTLTPVSFDDGVMAHMTAGAVVEGRFAWEDLGSWDSWVRVCRGRSPSLAFRSRNVQTVSTDGHLIATIGLHDCIVVHTPDATLICRATDTQLVRRLANRMTTNRRFATYR